MSDPRHPYPGPGYGPPPGQPPPPYPGQVPYQPQPPGYAQPPYPQAAPRRPAGQQPSGDPGPRPAAVTIAGVASTIMTLPFAAGAVSGIVAIVNGFRDGGSDAVASAVIFGGLAIVIAGGLGFLYGLGAVGILQRGNPIPSTMVTIFTIVIVIGAARRAFVFGSGLDAVVFVVWLLAVAGALTILVTVNLRSAKAWMAAKNRQFVATRRARASG